MGKNVTCLAAELTINSTVQRHQYSKTKYVLAADKIKGGFNREEGIVLYSVLSICKENACNYFYIKKPTITPRHCVSCKTCVLWDIKNPL